MKLGQLAETLGRWFEARGWWTLAGAIASTRQAARPWTGSTAARAGFGVGT